MLKGANTKKFATPVAFIGLFYLAGMSHAAAVDTAKLEQEATEIVGEFGKKLGKTMQEAMADGGPVSGVRACSQKALEISGEMSRKSGWKVTRVGTKVRNTLIGIPDPWEQKVLTAFQERRATGSSFDSMSFSEVVDEPSGKYYRYMKAIEVKPGCLQCHGDKDAVLPEVEMIIDERYPHDAARGYKAGDLRGAFSVKKQL